MPDAPTPGLDPGKIADAGEEVATTLESFDDRQAKRLPAWMQLHKPSAIVLSAMLLGLAGLIFVGWGHSSDIPDLADTGHGLVLLAVGFLFAPKAG